MKSDKLEAYKSKRDFKKTSEPIGIDTKKNKKTIFVIQKHAARRLHYDFRIEVNGVLKSWAVPKEPSLSIKDKRLAVHVEDHPLDYGNFEGVIPKGNYGAGTVELWDRGFFVNITIKDGKLEPLEKWIEKGHFLIWVKGDRLRGGYAFTRLKDGKNWLMIKMDDEEALENKKDDESPSKYYKINNKEIELTNPKKELFANITKEDFVDYFKNISKLMLPHLKDRPISMYRFPHGLRQEGFFQKHFPDYFPKWVKSVEITRKDKKIKYVLCDNGETLLYLATQIVVPHIWQSRIDKLEYPDRMVFDLDPSTPDLKKLKQVAIDVKKFMEQLEIPSFIMTTGGKGYHIIVPLDRSTKQEDVKEFAGKIASVLSGHYEDITDEMRIEKRENKVFIDTYRNSVTHTSVAPYSVRANLGGGIAVPFDWEQLNKIDPKTYSLRNKKFPQSDAWKDMFKKTVSINSIRDALKGK